MAVVPAWHRCQGSLGVMVNDCLVFKGEKLLLDRAVSDHYMLSFYNIKVEPILFTEDQCKGKNVSSVFQSIQPSNKSKLSSNAS